MLQDTVVIEGEVSLINQIDGDPNVIIVEGGGQTYPHYSGDYTVTPSTTAQVLDTDGKVMDDDVTVNPIPSQYIIPAGTKTISENGTHDVAQYESAVVDVQGGITPTGTKQISIASNGTVTEDVTNYASAEITTNVPASAVDTGTKSINSNGTHDVVGYANASVNVPNSYSASDEGKVVSNGALVAQTSDTVTANDTYDTTLIDELTVNVPTGSGGYTLEEIATKAEPSGAIVYAGTSLAKLAFAGSPITSFVGANVISTGFCCFGNCPNLTSISLPSLTNFSSINMNNGNFKLDALTALHIPNVQTIGSQVFTQMPSLTSLVLPKLRSTSTNGFNTAGSGIVTVDIGEDLSSIGGYAFNGSANILVNVILRKSDDIVALPSAGNLPNREINYYVPSDLISTYQTATNWSTKYASGYAVFHAIEGSAYENAYADGTPIS